MKKFSELSLRSFGNTVQLTGVVFSGDAESYLCVFPGEDYLAPKVLDMTLEDWQSLVRQTDVMETEVLRRAADGALTKVFLRKSQRQIEQSVSWAVYRRDGYACRYCGKDDVPLTVDHLVRWEEGGPSTVENLVACCRKCNRVRGDMEYGDWLTSPEYLERQRGLSRKARDANEALAEKLAEVPRLVHARSR